MRHCLYLIIFIFLQPHQLFSQYSIALGGTIHRYDQVIAIKGMRAYSTVNLGLDLGLGVERSLQGALAPQFAAFLQIPLLAQTDQKAPAIFGFLRYQFDFQQSAILDTYHGFYPGLGCALGKNKQLAFQFSVGLVLEQIYGAGSAVPQGIYFLNPQLQCMYQLWKK